MHQGLSPTDRKYSDDPAEQAYCVHLERWTRSYGASLLRLLAEDRSPSLHVLADFVWDRGALDLISPLTFETRDDLRQAGAGLPWADRNDPALYWRLMYAIGAEKAASADAFSSGAKGALNPIRHLMSVTMVLLGQSAKPAGGDDPDFLANAFKPGASPTGSSLLQALQSIAADQVRLRTGRHASPKPIEPFSRVKVGEVVALVKGYGHDGRILLDRETLPLPAQTREGLDWNQEPKHGRWQAWVMPWLVEPLL